MHVQSVTARLERDITRYYDALYEMERLSLLLFRTQKASRTVIEKWLLKEGFQEDEDGFWQSQPLLEAYRKGKAPKNAISVSWDAAIKNDPLARERMYCLRGIGPFLEEIHNRLAGAAWIYYQDITNTALQYPYIDQSTAIPHDFDWSTYHTWLSVDPEHNPEREVRWTPPSVDYAGEGAILSISIPVYQRDEFQGLWSIDVPMRVLLTNYEIETLLPGQENFILDRDGKIVVHPVIVTAIDKEKGSVFQQDKRALGPDFAELDMIELMEKGQGQLELKNKDGADCIGYYNAIKQIGWSIFAIFPKKSLFEIFTSDMTDAFERIKRGDLSFRIENHTAIDQAQSLINGYNEMARELEAQEAKRRKAENDLKDSEHRLAKAQALAHVGSWELVLPENHLTMSQELYRIVGLPENRAVRPGHILKMVHPEDKEKAQDLFQRAIENEKSLSFEMRIIRPDKEQRWIRNEGEIHYNRAGEVIRIFGATQDITVQKLAEQERNALEKQLRQAQKMEAIGTLAGGVAHDFNNILQAIAGYVELMIADRELSQEHREQMVRVNGAVLRAAELVRRLLTFSRKVEAAFKPLDLNKQILATMRLLERTLPKMISIELDLADELPVIKADPSQLEQILMNLGTNARDAMPDGGKFFISTETVFLAAGDRSINMNLEKGEYVQITITDNGHGMDQETSQHIFEPFFTTKGVGRGTGLGLSTVYGVVRNHGGHIECFSEPGLGTTFKILIPVPTEKLPEEEEVKPASQNIKGGDETIMVVDDDRAVLDVALKMLERNGYEVITAGSGEEAIEIYEKHGNGLDLVIMDLGMPGIGGYKALKKIVKINSKAKVLISSGYSPDGAEVRDKDSLAAGFVGKPYQLADMLRTIRDVLDG
ncbi:calcium-binding protein [Dethiosulfatarculus sandiegensis]|uniref:histidine kinase n=2 Tax=Dethiosulfatarculus sandiegensis TaxID=1429043 RepID=A0A0D2GFK5_9BACT|nr:calcium-binding protein [Dethiosulfatarculus sandiegensis]